MELQNKFEVGQEVYTVIRTPIEYSCPICEGTGKFSHNGYEVRCPHCIGTGKLTDTKTLWTVTELVRIKSIKATIYKDSQFIKYNLDSMNNPYTINRRPEEQIFVNKEDAEKFCYTYNHPVEKVSE